MANNTEQMRKYAQLLESQHASDLDLDEAFAPILRQKLTGIKTGLLAKFSQRHKGLDLIQKALVPYMKMFAQVMGRRQQNWDTVTWRTVGNFLTSSASFRLPMGDYEPQRLTAIELNQLLTSPASRAIVAIYLKTDKGKINYLLPRALNSRNLDQRVGAPQAAAPGAPKQRTDPTISTLGVSQASAAGSPITEANSDTADLAQRLITGLFVAVIQQLFDKAEGAGAFDQHTEAPQQPSASGQEQSIAQGLITDQERALLKRDSGTFPPEARAIINRALNLGLQESVVDVKTPLLALMKHKACKK